MADVQAFARNVEMRNIRAGFTVTETYLRRGTHRSTRQLEDAIRHCLDVYNAHPQPFIWSKTVDEILASLERFCERVQKAAG